MRKGKMNMWAFAHNEYDEYLERLAKHVEELSNPVRKTFKVAGGTIQTEQRSRMENPNGEAKWNGWQVAGTIYSIIVMDVDGAVVSTAEFEDKDTANNYFTEAKAMCKRLESERVALFQ